jgi:hypothetical protein
MKKVVLSFKEFVNESYNNVYEEEKKSENIEIDWDFNFDSGKFLKSDVGQDSLNKIESDFKKTILPIMKKADYIGQVITINLIASTSKVPLGPNAKSALSSAGYKDLTNNGLATARLDTLESIIKDLLFKFLALKDEKKEDFLKNAKDKVKIKKTPKPNQGPDYKSGDNKDDQKYKDVQKISSSMDVTAEQITEDRKVSCGKKTSGTGSKGSAENNFVGYEKNVFIMAKSGDTMTIKFDPFTVPDCFIYKYMGESKLSVFSGGFGGVLAEPFVQSKYDEYLARAEKGETIKVEKRNINGTNYIVWDYKKVINEVYNKDNALVNGINKKLKSLGIKGDIKSIQPKFFDSSGKIEIYANKQIKDMPSGGDNAMIANTKDYIMKKILPTPNVCDPIELQLKIVKAFVKDSLDLIVFSPCAGTSFALDATCEAPKG